MAKKKKNKYYEQSVDKLFEEAQYIPIEPRKELHEQRVQQREQQTRLFDGGSGSLGTKIKNTSADIGLNITKGILGATEGVSDFTRRRTADVLDKFGFDNKAKQLRNTANQNTTEGIASDFEHILYGDLSGSLEDEDIDVYERLHEKSALTDRSRGIAQSVGYSVTNAVMSSAMGGGNLGSLLLTGVSAGGSAESRAIEQGMDEDDAFIYGILSGSGEAVSEAFFGGVGKFTKALGYGKGALDDVLIENVTKRIGSNVLRSLTSYGLRAGGEGFEEILSAAFDTAAQKISGMDERSLAEIWQDQNVGQAFTDGVISSLFSSSPRLAESVFTGKNYDTGMTRKEQKVVDNIVEERTKGQKLSNKELSDVRQKVQDQLIDGKLSMAEIDKALGDTNLNFAKDKYITRTMVNENTKFTTNDDDLKINKSQLNKNTTLEDVQNKIKVLEQDFLNANNDMRNTVSSHELFNEMKNMIVATGEQQRLTSYKQLEQDGMVKLLTDKKGNPIRNGRGELQYLKADTNQLVGINGFHTEDGMTLNADSHKIFEATMGHELGESIKANTPEIYNQLKDLAVEVGRQDGTLTKETFDAIKQAYGELGTNTDNYLDEYVNDKIGEMFKSDSAMFQEIGKKPNIARRLLNEIKYLIQKFTAGSPEQKRLLEAQHNLKKALHESVRNLNVNQEKTQQNTDNIQQTKNDVAPVKEQVKETPKEFTEVTDEDLFNINMEEVENQFDKQEYKLNEDVDSEDSPFGNYWDLDDFYFELKDGNTLWIETPVEYGKYKNGKTNYQQENYNKIDFTIEDSNGEIIDEYSIENEKGEFTRDDILNAIKHMTYDDSNKVADGQLDIFDNVHRNDGHRYSLSQDNQGRQLSEQQQEYFKESKVRDNEGRLLEVYHGTTEDFNIFDRGSGEHGEGYYFTEDYDYADEWSGGENSDNRIVNAYLNLSNPLSSDVDLQSESMKKFIDGISAKWGLSEAEIKSCFEGSDAWEWSASLGAKVAESMGYGQEDVESIVGFEIEDPDDLGITDYNAYLGSYAWGNGLNQLARESGFDGIIAPIYNSESEGLEYIAFNSNQIKNVDNTKPTNNPDIRYSLSESKQTTDSNGKELSKEQLDYFKDTKILDDEGRLLEVYHGTPSQGKFTVFDPNRAGENTSSGEYGLYFTDSKEFADDFSYERLESGSMFFDIKGEKGNVYTNYLNVTNPLDFAKLTKKDISNLYDYASDIGKLDGKQQFIDNMLKWQQIGNHQLMKGNLDLKAIADNSNYDGIKAKLNVQGNENEYIVFNSNQVKNIDNTNPTDNPDIRYSLSQKVDSELDPLTDEQYEYFKNTKAVDQDGELELVHHGTPNQFNIFDISKAGANQFMDGFYFTNAIATARAFTGNEGGLYSTENDGVLDGYVNIEHPINRNGKDITFEQLKEMYDRLKNNPEYDDGEGMGWTLFDDVLSNYGDVNQMGIDNLLRTFYDSYDTDEVMVENMLSREKKDILYSTLRDVTGIDGEIIENPTGHDAFEKYFIAFNPDQFKLKDNKTPTDNVDMNLSLSNPNDIAPFGEGIKSEQIKPRDIQQTIQNSVQEAIAPIREQIQQIADEVVKSENLDDIELNLEPFMDMINGDNGQVLSNINKNYDQIMTNLQEQGLPKDAAQSFLQNMVHKYDQAFNRVKQRMSEKNRNKVQKMILDLQDKFTNRNAHIDKLAKDSGNQMIKYKGDLANNSFGQAQYNVQTAQTDLNGNEIGKGVNGLFEQAEKQGLGAVLDDYLFHKSNIERHAVGKGSQVPASVSEQLIMDYEKSYPQLKEWSKGFEKYYDNLLQLEVDSGLIDQDTYNLLRGEEGIYRSYMPFFENEAEKRYFDDAGDLKPIKTLKRAKGGANQSKLMGMKQAMTKQTMAVWNSMRTNQLYQEIINTLGGEEGLGFIVRNDPSNLSQSLYTDQDGNKFLTAYVDGREMSTKISEELYNELSRKGENDIKALEEKYSPLIKPLQWASNLRRNVLTSYNPFFALWKNPAKDVQDATLYSKHTTDMLKNLPKSYSELLMNKTKESKQFMALYGIGEYKGFGKVYAKMSEIIELAPRFAEFKASLQNGDSVEQAIYNAREVTTNFGRGGYVTKAMNRNGFTFLNASVQGFSKFIRNFSEQPNAGQFAMAVGKAAMLGVLPAIFNDIAFGSGDDKDEDYEALPNYIKDNYYLFKKSDGTFVRIPKGRALSVMGSAARRTIELAEGDEEAFEGYLSNAWSQIGPVEIAANPLDNTIVAPIVQALGGEKKANAQNTSGRAWYGGDIVPSRLQKERPEDQYDASIDKFSIWLGQKTGVSPYKINYVLDQYTGGLGDVALPMMTEETNNGAESVGEYVLAPLKDQLIVNSIDDNKYASKFYDAKDKLYVGSKATDEDKLKSQYMNDVSWDLSALYKEKREVQADSSLSKKEKYAKVQAIQEQINAIAKAGYEGYQDVDISGNYAVVNDDRGYYKNAKGEWKAESQSDIENVETLGLTDNEKSNYYSTKNELYEIGTKYQELKQGKTDEEKTQLNKLQKQENLEAIKNAPLPDSAKYSLYDSKYDDKLLPYYEDLGFSANDIITYKEQNFTADKDKKGKTIRNSKKTKVFNYINNMKLPIEQKAILLKKEYPTIKTYDTQIFNYINNSDLELSIKRKILDELNIKYK